MVFPVVSVVSRWFSVAFLEVNCASLGLVDVGERDEVIGTVHEALKLFNVLIFKGEKQRNKPKTT